jgi:hypothetical protein
MVYLHRLGQVGKRRKPQQAAAYYKHSGQQGSGACWNPKQRRQEVTPHGAAKSLARECVRCSGAMAAEKNSFRD